MSTTHEQRLQDELIFQADQAAKELAAMRRTSDAMVEQYRACKDWRTHRVECLIRFLTLHKPAFICDFGCGSGEMATRLGRLGYRVEGYDVSPELIEVARQRAILDGVADRVTFVVADGASDSLPKGKFDAVLAMSVLHHLPLEEGLRTLNDLLVPGGRIAIHEPVAYSRVLQWLRDRTPVPKDVSPDERQLAWHEIVRIGEVFEIEALRHYAITDRISRYMPSFVEPWINRCAMKLDQLLLMIPGMSYFAGSAVMVVRKR